MPPRSLEDIFESTEALVERFRQAGLEQGGVHWDVYREEHTNWIEEQRAWQDTCILMDQSYHLANYYLEGPDALRVNSALGVNDFNGLSDEDAPVGKQHPVCNPDGYLIGDPILFYLGGDRVVVTGNRGLAQKWIQYQVETGDYDATVTDVYSPYEESPPIDCRFEIQGPNARAVMEEATDGMLPDFGFFEMGELSIDGVDMYVLGHGMASVPGYEIFGDYEHHDAIKDRLLEVGENYGIRELGSKAYKTATVTTGWLPLGLPAVYDHPSMTGYREWLDADCVEANWSLGGSFESDTITDYYTDPVSLGYEHIIDFDHDFVGRNALAARAEDPQRTKVTFVWDPADVVDLYASLFREGEQYKYFELPDLYQQWDLGHFDEVLFGDEFVGVSIFGGYDANERDMLSLGLIDHEHAEPGTTVSIVWGEEDSPKPTVERHVETTVEATVAPAPYRTGREDL